MKKVIRLNIKAFCNLILPMVLISPYGLCIQTHLREITGTAPEHRNKVSHSLFAGGGSCIQFVKNTTSVKCGRAKCNKACLPVLV